MSTKEKPLTYLVTTPIEQLFKEGLLFEGEDRETEMINQSDFMIVRGIFTRCYQLTSDDDRMALIRFLKQMIKPDVLEKFI